jgi:hypothetical protein
MEKSRITGDRDREMTRERWQGVMRGVLSDTEAYRGGVEEAAYLRKLSRLRSGCQRDTA